MPTGYHKFSLSALQRYETLRFVRFSLISVRDEEISFLSKLLFTKKPTRTRTFFFERMTFSSARADWLKFSLGKKGAALLEEI